MKYSLINKSLLFFLIIVSSSSLANDSISFPTRIDTVFIIGNEHTRDHVIMREIPHSFPAILNENDFLYIQNRIQNLFLFNRVELHLSKFQDDLALIISVTESWYFFPVPLLFINERDWGKLSYGMQVNHFNFRGQNEKLSMGGWLGYNPSFYIHYLNPWLGRKKKLIIGFSTFHARLANKIFDFNETRSGFKVILGKQLTLKFKSDFELGFQVISFPEEYTAFSSSKTKRDLVPSLKYHLQYDKRDLYEYPKNGFYLDYYLERTGFSSKQPRFWQAGFDNRIYFPVSQQISLTARSKLILNSGKLPIYDRPFLGYKERIRGYFTRIFPQPGLYEHFNSFKVSLNSLEIRFPIIPIKYFTFDGFPLLSLFSRNLKYGLSGGFFVDSGIVWQDKSELMLRKFFTGFGGGLHLHLPYINILRLEYAANDKGETQFIIDAGVSF